MKKVLMSLLLVLVILCCAAATCAEGGVKRDQVGINLKLSGFANSDKTVKAGDTIQVSFRFTNTSGADFAGRMFLFDPAKERVGEFPLLKDGESAEWTGELTITEDMVKAGKFTYRLQFTYFDENGEKKKAAKDLNKKIKVAGKKVAAEQAPVFLYGVQDTGRQDGKVGVFCFDGAGIFWGTAEADLQPSYTEADLLQLLKERRGMKNIENYYLRTVSGNGITESWLKEQAARVSAIPAAEGTPKETGIYADEIAIYALKNGKDGSTEPVLLGMSGRRFFENTDPDAQELYRIMWILLNSHHYTFQDPAYGMAVEGVSPHGFRTVSVREFFGLEKVDPATAVITAVENDCEEGPLERTLTEEDREWVLALLERGIITRKQNSMSVTGGTMSYVFRSGDGEYLGSIEVYSERGETLAVANDGMYQMTLPTETTENLPAEEQNLLSMRIDGKEYQVGITAPRDMIRDGWKCEQTKYGSFMMVNADGSDDVFVGTTGDSLDEPVRYISPSSLMKPEYCGFDGSIDPENPEDPDSVWLEKAKEAAKANGEEKSEEYNPTYGGLYYWLSTGVLGEVFQEPDYLGGEITVDVTLSDGRQMWISANEWKAPHIGLREPAGTDDEDE